MKCEPLIISTAVSNGLWGLLLGGNAGRLGIIATIGRKEHPDISKGLGSPAAAGPINVKLTYIYPDFAGVAINLLQHTRASGVCTGGNGGSKGLGV